MSIAGALRAQRRLWRGSALDLGAFVDAGVSFDRIEIDPIGFAGPSPTQNRQRVGPLVRVGVTLDLVRWPTLQVGLTAGVWFRFDRLRLSLPAPFAQDNPDVDGGIAVPYGGLQLTVPFFDEIASKR